MHCPTQRRDVGSVGVVVPPPPDGVHELPRVVRGVAPVLEAALERATVSVELRDQQRALTLPGPRLGPEGLFGGWKERKEDRRISRRKG